MVVVGQALPLRRQSCPNLVQPLVTGRDIQFAVARDARQRACWMKDARNLASVALVKSVEVGLDHAFDNFEIVSAGHGGQNPSIFIFPRSWMRGIFSDASRRMVKDA